MSPVTPYHISSPDLATSSRLAAHIGSKLRGGEVIELVSDLGGGKTTFVRGFAHGAGSIDRVTSPSFTLTNVYRTPQLELHHFDFYRLNDPGILRAELVEIIADPGNVVIIEWAGIVAEVLPAERLTINIRVTGETSRDYILACPDNLSYLLPPGAVRPTVA
ncbi:MAG: tRNA (adenosine(37)-N6)-threonylcarbamoyltransferase complex ATPase subunit type 1 TsaE [Candidatus Saccharibacteria bacterium]